MAFFIGDTCIGCGACESECPVSCISADGKKYAIDEKECIGCGACKDVCPVGAPGPK